MSPRLKKILLFTTLTTSGAFNFACQSAPQKSSFTAAATTEKITQQTYSAPPILREEFNQITLPPWDEFLNRLNEQQSSPEQNDRMTKFLQQFDDLKILIPLKMALAVDERIDQLIRFQNDNITYKKTDYWATPFQTVAQGAGDCEDFTILKYHVLSYLGIPKENIYVAMVSNDGQFANHAVLIFDADLDKSNDSKSLPLKIKNHTDLKSVYYFDNDKAGFIISPLGQYYVHFMLGYKSTYQIPPKDLKPF